MKIREGDPLEIYTSNDGEVVFKKYSPMEELNQFADEYAQVLHKTGGMPVIICDKDHVVAVAGLPKKELLEQHVSPILERLIQNRRVIEEVGGNKIRPIEGMDRYALIGYPIIASSDVCGAVMYVTNDESVSPNTVQSKLAESAALVIGRQMEC